MLFGAAGRATIAQTTPDSINYDVVSEHDSATESLATRETLNLTTVDGKPTITILNDRGAQTFASETSADGQIKTTAAADSSVSCYNMAQSMLTAYAQNPSKPFVLQVFFVGKTIGIPLDLAGKRAADGSSVITASGGAEGTFDSAQASVPGGLMIAAKLVERDGVINEASFSELTLIGAKPQPVDRTQCAIERVAPHAATITGGVAT
jgi:hypothetical protein